MRPTLSLIKREFTAYFFSPIGFVTLAVFLLVTGRLFGLTMNLLTEPGPRGTEFPMQTLLGDEKFHAAMLEYMRRWHGKHPQPWDFFLAIDDASGRNLDWFWNNWYFGQRWIDLAVRGVATAGGATTVTVDNVGGLAAPFDVNVTYADGTTATFHQTPAVWQANASRATVRLPGTKAVRSVALDGGVFMDATPADNRWGSR